MIGSSCLQPKRDRFTRTLRTRRFVYHVSHERHRASIDNEGLNTYKSCAPKPAVYAHNEPYPHLGWYPFCFDELYNWGYFGDDFFELNNRYLGYDYWQIDTRKLKNEWYIDDIANEEFQDVTYRDYNPRRYILTFDPIPRGAIKLFRFQRDKEIIVRRENVIHVHYKPAFREYKL